MIKRCIHCGQEFDLEPEEGAEATEAHAFDDDLATCKYCGGIMYIANIKSSSLPSDYVNQIRSVPPSPIERVFTKIFAPFEQAMSFLRSHIWIQCACYLVVIGLSVAFLIESRPFSRKSASSTGTKVSKNQEDLVIECCKMGLAERLKTPGQAKYPDSMDVRSTGYGNFIIKSYVDDVDSGGKWIRIYFVCLLTTTEDGRLVVQSITPTTTETY